MRRRIITLAVLVAAWSCQAQPLTSSTAVDTELATALADNAAALFTYADTDRDGQLSRTEAGQIALEGSDFDALDTNHDGQVARSEFLASNRLSALASTFRQLATDLVTAEDLDKDGRLSWSEYQLGMLVPWPGPTLQSPLPDPQRASFDNADLDHDGYVSQAEAPRLIGFLVRQGYQLQQRAR